LEPVETLRTARYKDRTKSEPGGKRSQRTPDLLTTLDLTTTERRHDMPDLLDVPAVADALAAYDAAVTALAPYVGTYGPAALVTELEDAVADAALTLAAAVSAAAGASG
jgi:hypothetical protein